MKENFINELYILHADIQKLNLIKELIEDGVMDRINYLFISTHGEYLHSQCEYLINKNSSHDWVYNSRFAGHFNWRSPIKINSISLDNIVDKHGVPDLIKIDVEGYEYEVLKDLNKKVKEICFEWAEEQYEKIEKSIEHLISLGYENFGYILGDDYMKKPSKYTNWAESDFHVDINPSRKEKWGMIWVK